MSQLIKKENITIVIGEYTNQQGQSKKQFRTIGELITMQGDDGVPYQFGKLWGASGVTEIKVYPQDENRQQMQPQPQQNYQQQQPNGGYANQPQQNQQQPNPRDFQAPNQDIPF